VSLDPIAGRATLRSPLVPPLLTLGVILLLQFAAQLFQVDLAVATDTRYAPPFPLAYMSLAHADYRILSAGNAAYLSGARDLDAVRRQAREQDDWKRKYCYPPMAYRLLAGLNLLSPQAAHFAWLGLALLATILALVVTVRHFAGQLGSVSQGVLAITLLCLSQSTPFLFQIERGNFDWIALSLCLLALASLGAKRPWAAGFLIGVAAALKVYPLLLLVIFVCVRRWRAVLAALATIGASVLILGPRDHLQWIRFLAADRALTFGPHPSNVSIANLLYACGITDAVTLTRVTGIAFLALCGAFMIVLLWRGRRLPLDVVRTGLFALPYMFLVPPVHWAYTLFALLALLVVLAAVYQERPTLRLPTALLAVAIGISQSPITAPRFYPAWAPFVMPLYSITLLVIVLLSIWLVAGGAADAPRATPVVSV